MSTQPSTSANHSSVIVPLLDPFAPPDVPMVPMRAQHSDHGDHGDYSEQHSDHGDDQDGGVGTHSDSVPEC